MMKYYRRILALLLAGLMLVGCLAACGKDGQEGQNSSLTTTVASDPAQSSANTEPVDPKLQYDPALEADDWKGEPFTILYNGSEVEPNHDFTATELNGNVLNDAMFNRDVYIQDKYKVVFNPIYTGDAAIMSTVANSNKAGDDAYQLAEANGAYSMSMTINGYLANVEDWEYVDFDKPYWNSMVLEGSSLGGKSFFALSDACVHAYGATPCVAFNKQLYANYNFEDIYQIVSDGKWTYEKMSSFVSQATADLNSDGKITKDDMLGFISNNSCVDGFIGGSGYLMVSKDENDLPVLNVQTEQFYTIIDTLKKLMAAENGAFIIDRTSTATEAREYWTEQAFTADRALFLGANLKWAERLRPMENDFGIVPVPKVNDEQENYAVHIQANVGAYQSIPAGSSKVGAISKILEELAYQSYLTVTPAYYNVVLEGQSVRDEESIVTLNILRDAYYCDLGFMLGNSGISILGQMRTVITNNVDCASTLQKVMKVYETSLKKIYSNFS